jgi:hypothetical protein
MINPLAFFDCLSTLNHLEKTTAKLLKEEIQIFTYLACLLFLYDKKKPVSDWGYFYAGTQEGAPFSLEINDAVDQLFLVGLVEKESDYYQISAKGVSEYQLLSTLSQNLERDRFIDGACSSRLMFPIGFVREAISNEPELKHVKDLVNKKMLLEGPGIKIIYEQFAALNSIIGSEVKSLMVPASIWLNYLFDIQVIENP